eukprot:gene1434-17186_t
MDVAQQAFELRGPDPARGDFILSLRSPSWPFAAS